MYIQKNTPKHPLHLQAGHGHSVHNWGASQGPYASLLLLGCMYLYAIKKGDAKRTARMVFYRR
jgi:hypothetical protein